jgi:glycosyltransferase involved in cell wall biosynthesis
VRGIIVGDGPERWVLEEQAARLDLRPDGVEFLGSSDDVPSLLRRADVLLLTSENEGFPNAVLEAMAARLPVVTTDVGDAGRIVQDNVNGYVVDVGDVSAMAQRLLDIYRGGDSMRRLGLSGRDRVTEHFGVAALGRNLLKAYRAFALREGHQWLMQVIDRHIEVCGP